MLIDNIMLLRERYPHIRRYFAERETDLNTHIEVIESRSGSQTIRIKENESKSLMVHSMYDPVREAERVIASHQDKITDDTHVFFYGIGMGYHIEAFIEQYPNHSFSLYEPLPEIFYEMTSHRPLDQILTKKIKNLYVDIDSATTKPYLNEFNVSNRNIQIIALPSYKNIAKEKYDQFHSDIRRAILNRRTALHTNMNYQKTWVSNSLMNFSTVLATPNIVKDTEESDFKDKPAIIVSAGPSLSEDIEHIRYIKENNLAYIFSVGSAINTLIEYDVLPDAVFTYDPGTLNQKVFEKMIAHNIDDIPMVFGSSVGYETLEKYTGPKAHFITSQDRTSLYFLRDQLNLEQDLILDSPSIAVMAFQILNKLGANPIVFAGQNLGYLYDRLYSKGIEYDHVDSTVDKTKLDKAVITKDVYGNDIKTTHSFESMRLSIEKFAEHYKGNTFINTTKGGAAIKGVPFQPIEDVIKNTLNTPIEKTAWWLNSKNNYDNRHIQDKFKDIHKHIENFHKQLTRFENVLKLINTHTKVKNKSKVLDGLTQFDTLYNNLNSNLYYSNFLSFYIRVHVEYLSNDIKRLNSEPDLFVKGMEVVKAVEVFVQRCREGSAELEEIIKTVNFKLNQ
ncbi:motility associated factor glycosyltransferase family protein [Lentibacillus saliphilus]|uniref:motility associated factor glycosyltransferase family protein n=1 Tax=Lentibacillus saliphilus TaxID=2737028 RepID=UPI001C2FE2DD|nr:6-hydroxymethylpterin diphosphokinase MptE-like protein [Lentibacillus saliphilus]